MTTIPYDIRLPQASGLIEPQGGEAQFFQYTPVPEEDKARALQAMAARMNEFDAITRLRQEQEAIEELARQKQLDGNVKEASKAVEAARQNLAFRQFNQEKDSLVKNGVPEADAHAKALAKFAPMMFAGSPSAMLSALKASAPVRFVKSAAGQELAIGPNGSVLRMNDPNNLTAYQEAMLLARLESDEASRGMAAMRHNLALARAVMAGVAPEEKKLLDEVKLPTEVPDYGKNFLGNIMGRLRMKSQPNPARTELENKVAAAKARAQRLLDKAEGIDESDQETEAEGVGESDQETEEATVSAPIRIRRKTDGVVFKYPGRREDVPLDKYDIVE